MIMVNQAPTPGSSEKVHQNINIEDSEEEIGGTL